MKYALITNGAITGFVTTDVAFSHLGKQYSARFLRNSTKAEKIAAGVMEVVEGAQADQRFYWVSQPSYRVNEVDGVVEASYTATAKLLDDREESDEQGNPLYVQEYNPLTETMQNTTERLVTKGLKSQWIGQVKATANSLMQPSDWAVTRKFERNVEIPAATQTYRAAVVAECTRLEAAIAGAADVDALAAVVAAQNWPKA